MSKRCLTGCVAVTLMLATAGVAAAAPGAPGASPVGRALAPNEQPMPLGIQLTLSDHPLAGATADVASSAVGPTIGSNTVADTTPAAIPLPAGVYVGLVGLASTFAAWRRFKRRRL